MLYIEDILTHKMNVFSQNGEDGIIQYIFEKIGEGRKLCCEFGAWDGIHFSNCRNLILQGWNAVMIEGDYEKYKILKDVYKDYDSVITVHRYVDTDNNKLDDILYELNFTSIDFLSIDIDGLDYEVFESIDTRPRVICIEVNAGHNPGSQSMIPTEIAKNNVGQPLQAFVKLANKKGYELVCYTGNAFFVQKEICSQYSLPSLSSAIAYSNFLKHLSKSEREWLYLVNLGIVPPYYKFYNTHLDKSNLGIDPKKALTLRNFERIKQFVYKNVKLARKIFK